MMNDAASLLIRPATLADAPALLAIYTPIVRDTAISFEVEPPGVEEFAGRIASISASYPWLVAESESGEILGYAYASRYRTRAAYDRSVESTVYVAESARGRGVGRALYARLFALLTEQGIRMVYAIITIPNEGSVGLHEAFGFKTIGVHRNAGLKFGAWHEVVWMDKDLWE
jgi:L-amino acid N-acyltransferase YncA